MLTDEHICFQVILFCHFSSIGQEVVDFPFSFGKWDINILIYLYTVYIYHHTALCVKACTNKRLVTGQLVKMLNRNGSLNKHILRYLSQIN